MLRSAMKLMIPTTKNPKVSEVRKLFPFLVTRRPSNTNMASRQQVLMPSASAILTKNKSTFVSAPSPLTQTGVDQRSGIVIHNSQAVSQ